MKRFTVIFLFLILAGLYLYQRFFIGEPIDNSPAPNAIDKIIYVADQRPGSSVIINFATLNKTGYIVVQEDDKGEPGKILGNSVILPEGEANATFVGLIRPSINGEFLFAIAYDDNGDGFFSPNIDIPLKDEFGNIIFVRFLINRNADIIK